MPLLVNKRPTILGLAGGVVLKPDPQRRGVEVSDEALAKLNKDPTFQKLRKLGWVGVKAGAKPAESPSTPTFDEEQLKALEDAKGDGVKTLIDATDNLELLRAWQGREQRKFAQEALQHRIDQLSGAPDEEDDEDVVDT